MGIFSKKKIKTDSGNAYYLPLSYSRITLGQYVRWQMAQNNIQKVAAALSITDEQAMKLRASDVLTIVDMFASIIENEQAHKPNIIHLNGKKYGFIPNIDRMTFGEYQSLDDRNRMTFADGDWNSLLHMMDVLYREVTFTIGEKYRIKPYTSEDFDLRKADIEQIPMSVVSGALLFFSTIEIELLKGSHEYLTDLSRELRKEASQHPKKKT